MDPANEFRRLTEEANKNRDRRGRRYSGEARQLAVRYCREQRSLGRSFSWIARRLGVNVATLGRWIEKPEGDSKATPGFLEVAVAEEPPSRGPASIRMILPGGVRIDGLGTSEVIELIRALA